MEKQALNTVGRGAEFNCGGFRWTVLEHDDKGGTIALATKILFNRAFDRKGRNDWRRSSLREHLNSDAVRAKHGEGFLGDLIDSGAEHGAFMQIVSDLTSDDGMKDYGTAEDYVALLTCDLYRKHRDVVKNADGWWWTQTPKGCGKNYAYSAIIVHSNGTLAHADAGYGSGGVRPLLRLKSNTLVSTEIPEPVEEPDNRRYTECTGCGGEIGERYWSCHNADEGEAYCSEDCICKALGIEDWDNAREDGCHHNIGNPCKVNENRTKNRKGQAANG